MTSDSTVYSLEILSGVFLALACLKLPTDAVPLPGYLYCSLGLLLTAPGVYGILEFLGMDPLWSVTLATRWCARQEWIHLDTTFFAITRDAGSLLGMYQTQIHVILR